jgi:hypothetical protein
MKTRQLGDDFHAYRRTDREITKLAVAFHNSAKVSRSFQFSLIYFIIMALLRDVSSQLS